MENKIPVIVLQFMKSLKNKICCKSKMQMEMKQLIKKRLQDRYDVKKESRVNQRELEFQVYRHQLYYLIKYSWSQIMLTMIKTIINYLFIDQTQLNLGSTTYL